VRSVQVVVIGAGIIGLTTAARLLDAGCQVRVVTAGPLEATTSWLAAAVWFPTAAGPAERVAIWSATTYEVLAAHAAAGVPGVVMRESLTLYRFDPGRPAWVGAVGPVRPAPADELPPGYTHGLRFVVPLVEMPRYLPWLRDQVVRRGADLHVARITALADVAVPGVDVVVNCSGLAARSLAGDPGVTPVRGQIVRATNPGLALSVRDEHHPEGRAYVHPRRDDCILGGTFEAGRWDTGADPDMAASILRRCHDIVPGLAAASVIEHLVGLRPGRATVRLECDDTLVAGTRVVHNYGHGGSGVTVGWGCADDVAALVTAPPGH
jgi:D-amino-acid oxidase